MRKSERPSVKRNRLPAGLVVNFAILLAVVAQGRSDSKDKLSFVLPDSLGREIRSEDYAGTPVLIMTGSCWCGGCQQDAEPLREIAEQYGPKGLAVIRSVSGDNELAAIEFQKHYRLRFPQIMDTNREFERRYNQDGWTFLMLADTEGSVVYRCNGPGKEEWSRIKSLLDGMLKGEPSTREVRLEDVCYMPATLRRSGEDKNARRRDWLTSLAGRPDGKRYLVFTTNRRGNNDVFGRVFDGNTWSEDKPIAATEADEFDGIVCVDRQGQAWVSWTSDANGKKYNIFVTSLTDAGEPKAPVQITNADDDAMHGRMTCDGQGHVWVTYYKCQKLRGWSRDKEIYARCQQGGKWFAEVQVSPTDVPDYEDHTEPAIAAYGSGVVVCWSWDFHQPKGYTKSAELPTIFARRVGAGFELGKAVAVSGKETDVTPAIAVDSLNRLWFAWDSLGWEKSIRKLRKTVCLKQSPLETDSAEQPAIRLSEPVVNVCTPTFAVSSGGKVTIVWSESADGTSWKLMRAELEPKENRWSRPQVIESQGEPRYCSACYDSNEQLWVAYSVKTGAGREAKVRKLDGAVTTDAVAGDTAGDSADSNKTAVEQIRRAIYNNYSYLDLRSVDWEKLFAKYGPLMERAPSVQRFAELAAEMLSRAQDMHLWVKIDGRTIGGFRRSVKANYNRATIRTIVPNWQEHNKRVSTGRFADGTGYIMISTWSPQPEGTLNAAFTALEEFKDAPCLIIDVRPNAGGSEPLAEQFAGCFVEKPVVYAGHVYRNANKAGGFTEPQQRVLEPNRQGPKYRGKVAVLMGPMNMSSCEAFLLMMKQVPGCKLIGQRSYGSSGNPKEFKLCNGISVWLPSWKALRPDGSCFEGEGISPDIFVPTTEQQLSKTDLVIDRALAFLRG